MRTACIAGSPRPASTTRRALERCRAHLVEAGGEAVLLDLHEIRLPPMTFESYAIPEKRTDQVNAFTDEVLAADAIVLGTPVYHATFSALLKNALDLLPSGAFQNKPVGLVASVGGLRGGSVACDHLRTVVKALGGWAVPTQVVTHGGDFDGTSVSPPVDERLGTLTREVSWFSGLASSV